MTTSAYLAATSMGGAREPTAEEVAELRAMIESDIREIVATKQPGFIDSH